MFKIGDFAKLTRVPVRTLRYYDDIGLLKAAHIDPATGYRYYSSAQLVQLNQILALKDLGLSLEQISSVLEDETRLDDLRGMLRLKQLEIEQTIQDEQQRLLRIQSWLDQEIPGYEIVVKAVPAQTVAALQAIAPTEKDLPMICENLFQTLSRALSKHRVNCDEAGIVRYLDADFTDTDIHVEVLIPLRDAIDVPATITTYLLPEMMVASVAFRGEINQLPDVYRAILQWLDVQDYHIFDSPREIHLSDSETAIIEVQVPIQKIAP